MRFADPLLIRIVELVVFAFDVDRADVDRPVIGLVHVDAESPEVERERETRNSCLPTTIRNIVQSRDQ